MADGIAFPNGMALTPDNATLIIAESHGKKLTAFDIASDGSLSNRRVWSADAQLSFDKIRNDQTIAIRHLEGENDRYLAALQVWDQPNTSLGPVIEKMAAIEKMSDGPEKSAAENELRAMPHGVERVTVGRDRDSVAMLRFSDAKGRARIKLWVDASGTAKLEFFDEAGQVTRSFP